MHLPVED